MILRYVIVAIAIAFIALAFGIWRFVAPPGSPPDYRGPKPEPDTDGAVTHRESILIDASLERYVEWTSRAPLEEVLQGSDDVPRVVDTEPVIGAWDQVGARRRVVLEDGNYAAEQILEKDGPGSFRYQVWGYTSPTPRLIIHYAIGEFEVTEEDGMTRVDWTYSFKPRVGLARPALRRFVEGTWADYMRLVLETFKVEVERHDPSMEETQ